MTTGKELKTWEGPGDAWLGSPAAALVDHLKERYDLPQDAIVKEINIKVDDGVTVKYEEAEE